MERPAVTRMVALAVAIACIPIILWLVAVTFDSVDDKWLDSLGGLAVSVPIALGLAALVYASHGLHLHHAMVSDLDDGLHRLMQQDPLVQRRNNEGFTVAATAGTAPAMATSTAAPSTVAVAEEEPSVDDASKKAKSKKAKNAVKARAKSRAKFVAKGALNRQLSKFRI